MPLLKDMHRLSPAPTRERELAAAAANMALALVGCGMLLLVLQAPAVAAVLFALIVTHVVTRFVILKRRERRHGLEAPQ